MASDELKEQLLATYADRGEAMAIQTMLEAHQIPCRIEDMGRLPSHLFGIAGGLSRSVGLHVLDVDAERAESLLATFAAPENAIDQEALAAEAEAAPMEEPAEPIEADAQDAAESPQAAVEDREQPPPPIHPTGSPWLVVVFILAGLGALWLLRSFI